MPDKPPNSPSTGDLARQHLAEGDPTGWFEALYARANTRGDGVPWANGRPHPDFVEWLDERDIQGDGRRALVVGCGLGDDAEELARRGFAVTAFDVSQSAIDLCRQRFPASPVDYVVADLLDPPEHWIGAFPLVVEIITVQALPPDLQADAFRQVTRFVAPGGRLFVGTMVRDPALEPSGPPWPVSRDTLKVIEDEGLQRASRQDAFVGEWRRVWHTRAVFTRPADDA